MRAIAQVNTVVGTDDQDNPVLSDVITKNPVGQIYANLVRPGLVNQSFYDLRAQQVSVSIERFSNPALHELAPETVVAILADLQGLMPTPGQITASRSISPKRYSTQAC